MRNMDEAVREISLRTERLRRRKALRRVRAQQTLAVCFCLILIVGLAFAAASLPFGAGTFPNGVSGSMISQSPWLGYVMIGLLSFLFGVCVTLLCRLAGRRAGERKKQ